MRRLLTVALACLIPAVAGAQSPYFNSRNYGQIGTATAPQPYAVLFPTGADTTQVQAAISRSSQQQFVLAPGTFTVCGLAINSGQAIFGSGKGITKLAASSGCGQPVLATYNFAGLTGSGSAGGPAEFEIAGLTIDGSAATAGDCLDIYGRQFFVHDLLLTHCAGGGLWTEYTRTGNGTSPYDCHAARITVDTVGKTGWYNGCSDIHCDDMNIRGASQASTGTYDGIMVDADAAIHCSNINVWGTSFGDPTHRYALNLVGDASTIAGLHLETGRAANLFVGGNYNNVTALAAYNLPNAGTPVDIIVQGNNNFIQGVAAPFGGNSAAVAVQLGTATNMASLNTLLISTNGFANGLYDFTNDGGYNLIAGPNFLGSGTNIIGSANLNDTVLAMGSGGSSFNRSSISEASGLFSDGFTSLGLKTQHNVAFQGSLADQSYDVVAETSGFTDTVPNEVSTFVIAPTGALSSGTLTLPAAPLDGLLLTIVSNFAISSLTLNPNTGQTLTNAVTSLSAGIGVTYQWLAAPASTWIRRQ